MQYPVKLPIVNLQHLSHVRKWMAAEGMDPNRTYAGNDGATEYCLKLVDDFGPGLFVFQAGQGIEHRVLNDRGYSIMAPCIHRDDIVSYLWGKEVTITTEIADAPETPPYFEDHGLFYCNYEDCEKVLKSAKGIKNHIDKEHE